MAGSAHIAEVMEAVRARILTLKTIDGLTDLAVEIANPAQHHPRPVDATSHLVTLFLYRIEPDHAAMLAGPDRGMAVRLKVMITVYGGQHDGAEESIGSIEMRILSHIMRLFLEQPQLGPIRVRDTLPLGPLADFVTKGVTVEAQQLSLDMEEVNHIWTTQGDTPFRTSLVYSFNYGLVVPSTPSDVGPPVLQVEGRASAGYAPNPEPPLPELGALAFVVERSDGSRQLHPSHQLRAGTDLRVALLCVTEAAVDFDLRLDRLNSATGVWEDQTGQFAPNVLVSTSRAGLDPAAMPVGMVLTLTDPGEATVYRLSVRHAADPDLYDIAPITLVVEAPAP